MKRNHLFILIFFYMLIFLAVAGCSESPLRKTSFSQSGIDGLWRMVAFGQKRYEPFNNYSALTINVSGDVTGGDLVEFGVNRKIFTDGRISTTDGGAVTGFMEVFLDDTNTYSKYRILGGQTTLSRDVIVYAGNFHLSNRGIGILIRSMGSFTGFDLEGTWVFPLEGIFSVSINNSGAITGCSFLSKKGDSGTCSGTFSITPQGAISGEIKAINGRTFQIDFNGQMNSGKNAMIFAGSRSDSFRGMATVAVRREGAFSSADGHGDWKIFITDYNDAVYGAIKFDNSGKVTGGNWDKVEKNSGTFTGGTLLISKQGEISGFINTSTGNNCTLLGGQMSSTKDLIGGMLKDNSGRYRVMVLVKFPD